jgi:hypothetical protein
MGFDQRPPTSGGVSPISSPNLPIADSSQGHDIPTGVAPSLAKLQDWSAWLATYSVLYLDPTGSPGLIANDITVGGDLTVTGTADIAGAVSMGSSAAVGTDLTVGDDLTVTDDVIVGGQLSFSGTQPASNADPGAHTLHSTNIAKCWAFVETDGAGGTTIHDAFNVTSATVTGGSVRVTFTRGFANSNFSAVVTSGNNGDFAVVTSRNAAYVDVAMYDASSPATPIDPATFFLRFNVLIHGRHT